MAGDAAGLGDQVTRTNREPTSADTADGAAGLEFDQPLYPPVYDHLLAEWPAREAATGEDSDSPPLPHG